MKNLMDFRSYRASPRGLLAIRIYNMQTLIGSTRADFTYILFVYFFEMGAYLAIIKEELKRNIMIWHVL